MDVDKRGVDPNSVSRPLQRPVFDIARPRTAAAANVPVTPAPAPTLPEQPADPPVDESMPSSVPTGTVISPDSSPSSTPAPQPVAPQDNPKKRKRLKKPLLIMLATLVVVGGAAGTYWYLTMHGDHAAPVATEETHEEAMVNPSAVTATTIDSTLSEIESTLSSLNDTDDFNESAFSDESLGL